MSQDLVQELAPAISATEKSTPWSGFKYAPVRGLVDRKIARFLRTQRKNMRRFFHERGMSDLAAQMDELRGQPNRGFMQKNRSFQRILNEHIARSNPQAAPPAPVGDVVVREDAATAVTPAAVVGGSGDGSDAGESVRPVVHESELSGSVPIVIEE